MLRLPPSASLLGVVTRFLSVPALGLCGFSVVLTPSLAFYLFLSSRLFSLLSFLSCGCGTRGISDRAGSYGLPSPPYCVISHDRHAQPCQSLISLLPLQPAAVGNTPPFLRYLTTQLHQLVPGGLVLWYDSVVQSGQLKWQDELNEQNR